MKVLCLTAFALSALVGSAFELKPGVQIDGAWIDADIAAKKGIVLAECRAGDVRWLTLENRTGGDLRLDEFGWRRVGADDLSVSGVRVWLEGWQMATPCGLRTAEDCDFNFDPGYLRFVVCEPKNYVRGEKGRFRAENMVAFRRPDGQVRLVGFTTAHDRFGHFRLKLGAKGLESLDCLCACDRAVIPSGTVVRGERLLVLDEADSERAFARYAETWATDSKARRRFTPPIGWSSWYCFFGRVTLQDCIDNADWFAAHRTNGFEKVSYMQLDAGYAAANGDWLTPNEKFPGGLAAFSREMRARGFKPAVWFGPFMVDEASALFRAHPDWVLRDARGNVVWVRTGKVNVAALDATNPEVERHLEDLYRTIRSLGIEYVKLDFCMYGCASMDAVYHDPTATRAQALRRAFEAIRRGFGEDGFILGCTTPFGPVVGFVDAMRSSTDIVPYWKRKNYDEAPTVPNVCRNIIQHTYMNGRLWINDPDTLIVRDNNIELTENEVRLWERAVELVGGSLMLSDDFTTLSAARRPLAERALARINCLPAWPDDRWERTLPTRWRTAEGVWTFDFADRHEVTDPPHAKQ